jgi:hypothetical protein
MQRLVKGYERANNRPGLPKLPRFSGYRCLQTTVRPYSIRERLGSAEEQQKCGNSRSVRQLHSMLLVECHCTAMFWNIVDVGLLIALEAVPS